MKDPATQKYIFPTRAVLDKEVLNEAKLILWEKLTELKFTVHHGAVIPSFANRRPFSNEEI